MAQVKSTKKTAVKKAAPKKAAVKKAVAAKPSPELAEEQMPDKESPSTTPAQDFEALQTLMAKAVHDAVSKVSEQFDARLDAMESKFEQAAEQAQEVMAPVQDQEEALAPPLNRHGPRLAEAEVLETNTLSPEEAATMTPEQIEAYNQREVDKMRARKRVQTLNRQKLEQMGTADRIRALTKDRDPNVIRVAIPDGWAGTEDDLVRVECLNKIGLDDYTTSEVGELIDMPRENAKILQAANKVQVAI